MEGLRRKSLHVNLYGKRHESLKACIKDAIDLDDNCKIYGNINVSIHSNASSTKSSKTNKTYLANTDAIADLVMKKMNQVFKPQARPQEQLRYERQYYCGGCGWEHRTSQFMLNPQI